MIKISKSTENENMEVVLGKKALELTIKNAEQAEREKIELCICWKHC